MPLHAAEEGIDQIDFLAREMFKSRHKAPAQMQDHQDAFSGMGYVRYRASAKI